MPSPGHRPAAPLTANLFLLVAREAVADESAISAFPPGSGPGLRLVAADGVRKMRERARGRVAARRRHGALCLT